MRIPHTEPQHRALQKWVQALVEKHHSQTAVGRLVGLTQSRISGIVHGTYAPSVDTFILLAILAGASRAEFLDALGYPPDPPPKLRLVHSS
jgi:transcriptional regulator with XRE-family HTH domain